MQTGARLYRKRCAPLGTTRTYNRAPALCFHARAKSMRACPLYLGRLIGSFHDWITLKWAPSV